MRNREERRRQLLLRREAAVEQASQFSLVLRATLRRRYVRCGKPGCHCREGRGHGPFIYLSTSHGAGRTRQITVGPEACETARLYVQNYHRLWRLLEKISDVNWQLLRERLLPEHPVEPSGRRTRRATRS